MLSDYILEHLEQIIIIIVVSIILLILYKIYKNSNRLTPRIVIQHILNHLILYLILILGFCLILLSSNMNENLDGQLYTTNINIKAFDEDGNQKPNLTIEAFIFYYDFTEQEGNISFKAKNLSYTIDIGFPRSIKNESLEIICVRNKTENQCTKGKTKVKNNTYTNYNYSILSINDIILEKDDLIIIKFKSEMTPKGKFNFIIDTNTKLREDSDGNIHLKLGDEHQCISPCIYYLKNENVVDNVKEEHDSFDKDIKLKWQLNETEKNNIFYMNTFSRDIKFQKELICSIGIALLVSMFVMLIQPPKDKEKKFKTDIQSKLKIKEFIRAKYNKIPKKNKIIYTILCLHTFLWLLWLLYYLNYI